MFKPDFWARLWSLIKTVRITATPVVEGEAEGIKEWFVITDYVFKFFGWLVVIGVVWGAYVKTKSLFFLLVWSILNFFMSKLLAKIFLHKFSVEINGNRRTLERVIEAILFVCMVFLINLACAYVVEALGDLKVVAGGGQGLIRRCG